MLHGGGGEEAPVAATVMAVVELEWLSNCRPPDIVAGIRRAA